MQTFAHERPEPDFEREPASVRPLRKRGFHGIVPRPVRAAAPHTPAIVDEIDAHEILRRGGRPELEDRAAALLRPVHRPKPRPFKSMPNSVVERIMHMLPTSDVGRMGSVDKRFHKLADNVLYLSARNHFPAKSMAGVSAMDTSDTRRAHGYLTQMSKRGYLVFRAMNARDAKNLKRGRALQPKGRGADEKAIADHVAQRRETGLISASQRIVHRFNKDAHGQRYSGSIAIRTPRYYAAQQAAGRRNPRFHTRPVTSRPTLISHGDVMDALAGEEKTVQQNATRAGEVLFPGPVAPQHVIHLSAGLPAASNAEKDGGYAARASERAAKKLAPTKTEHRAIRHIKSAWDMSDEDALAWFRKSGFGAKKAKALKQYLANNPEGPEGE